VNNKSQTSEKETHTGEYFLFADGGAMVAAGRTKLCKNNLKLMKTSNRWKQDSLQI
jgi:hypothetical protein